MAPAQREELRHFRRRGRKDELYVLPRHRQSVGIASFDFRARQLSVTSPISDIPPLRGASNSTNAAALNRVLELHRAGRLDHAGAAYEHLLADTQKMPV